MSTTRSPAAVFGRLRQPEYAGENRRAPGTAANLLIGSAARDGEIRFDRETGESCCRSTEVVAATRRECGTRLLEAECDGGSALPAG